jgi:hypothetical protein
MRRVQQRIAAAPVMLYARAWYMAFTAPPYMQEEVRQFVRFDAPTVV